MLSQLTEKEVRYICSRIPLQSSVQYFNYNPKQFAKIMPGFRAKSLRKDRATTLLCNNRNRGFISSFIETNIKRRIDKIKGKITKSIEDGDSREMALLHALPFSFFADNVGLYFKLTNEKHSEEYIELLNAAVKIAEDELNSRDKLHDMQEVLETKNSCIEALDAELSGVKSQLENTEAELRKQNSEVDKLRQGLVKKEEFKAAVQENKEKIAELNINIKARDELIDGLKKKLAEAATNREQLEAQLKEELEKQHVSEIQGEDRVPNIIKCAEGKEAGMICPEDMEEFEDYLGYNLDNIGLPADSDYYELLKTYLCKILFRGMPVVVNRRTGMSIIQCIANALVGDSNVRKLVFSKGISMDEIDHFLMYAGRIACLDNFIGNYNETELLPLLDRYRNKIIFLTTAYDRAIHYVSTEFLYYCQYLNLNRIPEIFSDVKLTEDPSKIHETEKETQGGFHSNRYAFILQDILDEFDFPKGLAAQKSVMISDEQDLCCVLAFDVLPYCMDVLHIAPYSRSERLIKYAGDIGRCPYKDLLQRWFA